MATEPPCKKPRHSKNGRLVFLGTGSSAGTPILRDLLQPTNCPHGVCAKAQENPHCHDNRGPPSLLVQRKDLDGKWHNLLIDCGPNFKAAASRIFPSLGVRHLDAVLLTHGHHDAIAGLNDLREIQAATCEPGSWKMEGELPIYANERTLREARSSFPFLFPSAGDPVAATLVGRLVSRPLEADDVPFVVDGFDVTPIRPLPVEHGKGYISLGFEFGGGSCGSIAYISDISCMPQNTLDLLAGRKIAILIIDAIFWESPRPSHFSVLQALDVVRQLRPARALLVGMSCHLPHDSTNIRLKSEEVGQLPCEVQLAFDGMIIDIELC